MVACLRKIQKMPMDEILAEYHAYADPKAREGDIALIKAFDPEVVFEYSKEHGYFDGYEPSMKRLDSGIINIDGLAAALGSGAMDVVPVSNGQLDRILSTVSNTSSMGSDDMIELKAQ